MSRMTYPSVLREVSAAIEDNLPITAIKLLRDEMPELNLGLSAAYWYVKDWPTRRAALPTRRPRHRINFAWHPETTNGKPPRPN